jgi:beta-galactosidase
MDDPAITREKLVVSACCLIFHLLMGMMILANPDRAELTAEVKSLRGSPTIFVNGVAISPLMFFGWAESGAPALRAMALYRLADVSQYVQQVKLARDAGVHIYSFGVSMPWPKPGEAPDFSQADQAVELTLGCDPWGLLMPRFDVGPPEWWLELHPEDRMLFDDGKTEGWSVASETWRQDMLENLKVFVRHLEGKYGDHILGYHPTGQHTGEWFYFRSWEPRLCDFSPAMSRGFGRWARGKYQIEEALRSAWNDAAITFDQIHVPSPQEQLHTDIGFFRDPEKERKVIDYFEYKQQAMVEPLENIARTIKKETGGKKLVCLFYGYIFDMHDLPMGPQGSGHLAMARMIKCPDVDILCSPISYLDRGLGGAGCFMSAVDSVRGGGKLWLNEDDTRTHLSAKEDNFGRVDTPQQTSWVHQRNFAQLWPRRLASWYMDLGGTGWLNGKDIWDNISVLQRFYQRRIFEPARWSPDVALIVDETSPFYTACTSALHSPLVYQMRSNFFRLGTSFRIHLLGDLLGGRRPRAKVYFFANCYHLDAAQRAAIQWITRGRTAVWFYGGGFLGTRADDANISAVTGMTIVHSAAQPGKVTPDPAGAALTEGLSEVFGTGAVLDPLWKVLEQGVVVLGRYANGDVAAAAKWTPGGLRVYIGALHCPAKMLRNILRASGVHLYSDSDDVVLTDGKFLGFIATSQGPKHLTFRAPCTVVRILDGQEIVRDVSSLDLFLELGETKLYLLKTAAR